MSDAQWQLLPAVLGNDPIKILRKARGHRKFAEAEFGRDLVPGNSAYKDCRVSVAKDCRRGGG